MHVAILAHGGFPERAKTALGVLRYGDDEVVAVLDRTGSGDRVAAHVTDVQDAPIVSSMRDVERPVDALLIGIAPIGGGFDERWREDVRTALERGADVLSGLHAFLSEDEEFAALARENGCEIRDLRRPPTDVGVADGIAGDVDAEVILTVGTDCSVGKMTTTMALARDAHEAGYDVAVVPTGQTGVAIERRGIVVDRVPADFAAGAVEEMVLDVGDDHEYLFVEGQGSIVHPAYSGVTCAILHGSMADRLVLCHEAGRERINGYETFAIPSIRTYVDRYESLSAPVSGAPVVAGTLDTSSIEDDGVAADAVDAFADALDGPATDVLRFETGPVLEVLL